jgi:succinate dehydrogenase / fumarate reductase cytochrome b subunit
MSSKQRPISPFMIGPYYKPQMTSLMSITHRLTGVFLSVVGAPLLLWWIAALGSGKQAYDSFLQSMSSLPGKLLLIACALALSYHLLNGIRHLVWDTGRGLDIKTAYTAGWLVLIGTVILAAILLGAWL